ncbi:MAG: MBL fold metallo-hydrolase [Erysipelotrichaceae bacterium]
MHFAILASGSKGNCSIIESGNTRIIIDCGTTKKYLTDSFNQLNFDYQSCDGLLITHSHSDHISQLKMFSGLKVYSPFIIKDFNCQLIKPLEIFTINDLTILPIPLSHDCYNTVGYIIFDGKETLVQLTDSGYVSESNQQLIKGADYYIIESNHDVDMLMNTSRPLVLKKRILSDNGHLSNDICADVISKCIGANTKQILLAHISQQANTYQLAYQTMIDTLKQRGLYRDDLFVKAVEQFEIYDSRD